MVRLQPSVQVPAALDSRVVRLLRLVAATEPGGTCEVVAAPGYGTSTLLGHAAEQAREPVVSIRVRPEDDLWAALAGRLRVPGKHVEEPCQDGVLQAVGDLGPSWVMVDIAGASGGGPTALHREVTRLAEHLPDQARLLVAAHQDTGWAPSTVGRLIRIDEAQLSFRPDEAVPLLAGLGGADQADVWELSQGWVTALLAVARRHQLGEGHLATWLAGPGAQHLLQGWFGRIPRHHRNFLSRTALLDELTADACDAVLDRTDSKVVLGELVRDHRFVRETADDPSGGLRRHPLVTCFLRRLGDGDDDRAERHSRAADWFAARDDVAQTMHHLIAAGRVDDAGQFLRRHEPALYMSGGGRQVADWYERLPAEPRDHQVGRMLRMAWGHALSGDIGESQVWLARLRAMEPFPDSEPLEVRLQLEGEIFVLEAYLAAFSGDAATMAECGRRAIGAFGGASRRDAEQLAYVLRIKGLQWRGDHRLAAQMLDSLAETPFPNDMIRESSLAGLHVSRLRHEGRIHEALALAERAISWLDSSGLPHAGERQLRGRGEWAATILERGDLATAAGALEAAADACARHGRWAERAMLLVAIARLGRARHDLGSARNALHDARGLLLQHCPGTPLLNVVDIGDAAVSIDAGNLVRAERIILRLPADDERQLVWARAMIARGADPRRALAHLTEDTPRINATAQLLRADAASRRSSRLAMEHLLQAADLAHDTGQGLLLLDATPRLVRLARDAHRRNRHERLAEFLEVARGTTTAKAANVGVPLSRGELELLPLLPSRETVDGIADILGVSRNTAKTRIQRLYRKLGVVNRLDAVTEAQERGLL